MAEKYDLIFGIGEACSCTQILRKSLLQNCSYPLDWLYGLDFSKRVDILVSEFSDFINKEDLEYTGKDNGLVDDACDIYKNNKNGIHFNHDFKKGVPLDESYDVVKAKYDRRINRLITSINKAERVLIVYLEIPNHNKMIRPSKDSFLVDYQKIKEKFPLPRIDVLYLVNDENIHFTNLVTENISEHIKKVSFNYKSHKENALDYAVDGNILKKFFRKYRLNISIFRQFVNFLNRRLRRLKKGKI